MHCVFILLNYHFYKYSFKLGYCNGMSISGFHAISAPLWSIGQDALIEI